MAPSLTKNPRSRTTKLRLPPSQAPPPPRRPWITPTVIASLLLIARTQYLPSHSPHSLAPEILTSIQEEWHHIVHDTFLHFTSALRCPECGDRVDWCGDEGVVWYLSSLREEMDGMEVEDVDEERCARWDGGLDWLRGWIVGERVGKDGAIGGCWFGMDEEWEGSEDVGGFGEDGNVEAEIEVEVDQADSGDEGEASTGPREEDEFTGSVQVIEGLEALHERGAELTADGFVRYGSPLWGSVTDEPLEGDAATEVVAAGRHVRFKSSLWDTDDEESLDLDIPKERSLISGAMDQNYSTEECEDDIGSPEPITQYRDINVQQEIESGQEGSSSEFFEVKRPINSEDDEFAKLFSDNPDELSEGNDRIETEVNKDDLEELAEDCSREVCDSNSQNGTKAMDQASEDVAAMRYVTPCDAMELDAPIEWNAEIQEPDKANPTFEVNEVTQEDIDMDFEELFASDQELDESYDDKSDSDEHRHIKTSNESEVDEAIHSDTKLEEFLDSDPYFEGIQASEIGDENENIDQDSENDEDVNNDYDHAPESETQHQIAQDSDQVLWGDIYQPPIKDEDDEEEDGLAGFANLPGLPTKSGSISDAESDLGAGTAENDDEDDHERCLGSTNGDGIDIHAIVEPEAVEETQESSQENSEEENIPYVTIGYGAQFQGVRIYNGDESEESEEE